MPLAVAGVALVALLALLTDAADSIPSLADVHLRGVRAGRGGSGVLARRLARGATMTGEPWPRALARLTGRNRRRYGGYLVHAGIAVLFLGVAALVGVHRAARRAPVSPGEHVRGRTATRSTYRRADRPARRRLGGHRRADLARRRARRHARGDERFTLHPSRNYYSTQRPVHAARSRASSRARPPARWTCAGGCARTSGSPCGPTWPRSRSRSASGDREFSDSPGDVQAIVIARAGPALPQRPAAGRVPRDRLAAGGVDLDRRRDRAARRPDRGLALARGAPAPRAVRSTRRGSGASSARLARVEYALALLVLAALVALAVAGAAARGREAEERREEVAARGARGGQGGQVPRDPRRRARPPHGQALGGGLAGRRPRAARRRRSRSCGSWTRSRGARPARWASSGVRFTGSRPVLLLLCNSRHEICRPVSGGCGSRVPGRERSRERFPAVSAASARTL